MLKRVSIQNFKSLKDVTLDLQKINLLIGPNNSGKTNFLKALELVGDTTQKQKYYTNQIVAFSKKFSGQVSVKLFWPSDKSRYDRIIHKTYFDSNHIFKEIGYYKLDEPDSVYNEQISELEIRYVSSLLIEIYRPDPNKLTKPGPVGTGAELVNADASNLVGFLDRMLGNKYRKIVFNRIEDDLHRCVPEFDQIELDDVDATEELIRFHGEGSRKHSFKRLGLSDSQQGVTYWADELSEGTLYFLALLCIINQPNPPKLLLLEEPEKGIHPRRIWEVMKFIFQLAEEKNVQIILTTHNEHVVNAFSSMPESIFVFDKDEETGETTVRNLQKDIIEESHQKSEKLGLDKIDFTENLGDSWLYGLIGGVPANDL